MKLAYFLLLKGIFKKRLPWEPFKHIHPDLNHFIRKIYSLVVPPELAFFTYSGSPRVVL